MAMTSPSGMIGNRGIRMAEWFAEVAYIPPGAHRLLTALGLTGGLWSGRALMDIATAHRTSDGKPIPRDDVPHIFRGLHGIMRYNPYSDRPADRWKAVVDGIAPVAFGGIGAYLGSGHYFHGNEWRFPGTTKAIKAWSGISRTAKTEFDAGRTTIDVVDHMAGLKQSDAINVPAAIGMNASSQTGFQLFSAWLPGSSGLSAERFMMGAGRKPWIPFLPRFNRWLGNRGTSSLTLMSALGDMKKWMEANLMTQAGNPESWATAEALLARAKSGLQIFKNVTPEQEQKLVGELGKLVEQAHGLRTTLVTEGKNEKEISEAIYKFLGGANQQKMGLTGECYERLLMHCGLDLREARLGDFGPFTFFSRLIGSAKGETEVWKKYGEHLQAAHGIDLGATPAEWAAKKIAIPTWQKATAYGSGAGILATGALAGGVAAERLNKKMDKMGNVGPGHDEHRGHGFVGWINGTPLDVMHWASRLTITPPSMHRLMNAAYLSLTLYGGMQIANALSGRKLPMLKSGPLANSAIAKEEVWGVLKPLYGKLAYTPGSSLLKDRWRQVAHYLIPVGLGIGGTYTGSYLYFRDRINKLERPETLEDYTDKILLEQSKPYAWMMAVTSIFNTGSGIHLVPGFSYATNLQNRYLMASGNQVAVPGIGQWWSGNPGLHPWGVKRTLNYISSYLTYNPDKNPRELSSLVHSVIAKLYPDLPQDKLLAAKREITSRLMSIRVKFFLDDTIPANRRPQLESSLKAMTSGAGFERLLLAAGLDPAQANLASNGASGKIGNWMGSRGKVKQLQNEYRKKFADRRAHDSIEPSGSGLVEIADSAEVPTTRVQGPKVEKILHPKPLPGYYPAIGT